MTKKLICLLRPALIIMALGVIACGCSKDDGPDAPNSGDNTEIKITLPASVDVVKGQPCTITQQNGTIKSSDLIYLEKDGTLIACTITEATDDHFTFNLPANFTSGTYRMHVKRGDRDRVFLGSIVINIVEHSFDLKPETTVYGVVESEEGPLAGVVVSDGVECTVTDADGIYQLASKKENGYVFVSIPSGYEPDRKGVFPDHYRSLIGGAAPENHSFKFKKADQTNYRLIFMGDMHVANRSVNNDLAQFKAVSNDINNYAKSLSGKVYGITLGDMTWDLYWYSSKYNLADYAKTINEQIPSIPIYHTIGNHDNDMNGAGLFGGSGAKNPFCVNIAPPYYSFNIGGVHYVVLDNINTSKYVLNGGENNRGDDIMECGKLYDPQLAWIAKDLQYVDKSTPIVVTMHVPVHDWSQNASGFSKTMADADKVLSAFEGYNVHYVTGHTHRSYNVVPEDAVTAGRNIYEHNLSALCSDWWWSGNLTPGFLQSTDGTPAGYGVWEVSGNQMKWIYKCAGKPESFQFRAYDLNEVSVTRADCKVPAALSAEYGKMIQDYDGSQKNVVLINVWGMNSRWKVSVKTADGQQLAVTRVSAYDPVQLVAHTVKRFDKADASAKSAPIGTVQKRHHFFKATAPDADTDLVISVTDEFGHTWTETMQRPMKFIDGKGSDGYPKIADSYKISIK